MIPKFPAQVKGGVFALNNKKVWKAYAQGLKDGHYYLEVHKVKGPSKTLEQLGYYYAVIVPTVLKQMKEDGNERFVIKIGGQFKEIPLTEDVVDMLLKEACAEETKSKAKMSKEECAAFIERVLRWAAKWLHCVIPDPNTGET